MKKISNTAEMCQIHRMFRLSGCNLYKKCVNLKSIFVRERISNFKMIKSRIIAAAAAAALITSALALYVQGDELIYDSQSDPLVSLSYINDVVVAEYDKKLEKISANPSQEQLDKLSAELVKKLQVQTLR